MRVIDYTKEDVTAQECAFDVVFEAVGKISVADCVRLLKPGGVALLAGAMPWDTLRWSLVGTGGRRTPITRMVPERADAMKELRTRIEKGALRAVIDRIHPLERIAEAHAHVDTGHKAGNAVVTMG